MSTEWVEVAVGVLYREDGCVLLNSRPKGKPYENYWEFPGGKVESGETSHQALARELKEELGIDLRHSVPWFTITHEYEHANVRLHFRRAWEGDYSGTMQPKEEQEFAFFKPDARTPDPILPASEDVYHRAGMPVIWEDSVDMYTLSLEAHRGTVVRKKGPKYMGAVGETYDDAYRAKAMNYDYLIVKPEHFEQVLNGQEPLLPVYVLCSKLSELRQWQEAGAHGIKVKHG